jgi:hypothetical protein
MMKYEGGTFLEWTALPNLANRSFYREQMGLLHLPNNFKARATAKGH